MKYQPMNLFDFSNSSALTPWESIDDRVMGGVSQSEMASIEREQKSLAAFRGELSLRNKGGFCSVRAAISAPWPANAEHLWIQCANNAQWGSKRYSLNVRTSKAFDGVSYRISFMPGNTLTRYEFTAAEFEPVFRGKPVSGAEALHFLEVQQIGLMVADKQTGRFELLIAAIGAG